MNGERGVGGRILGRVLGDCGRCVPWRFWVGNLGMLFQVFRILIWKQAFGYNLICDLHFTTVIGGGY